MNMNAAVARSLVRFASRGITLDEARTLPVIFGCVGTGIQGKGSYVTFEGQPNLAKLVEFAMYDGYDPHTRKQVFPNVKPAEECATFEELYDALLRHMDHAYDAQRKISDLGNSTREQIVPNIFRSCLLDGCIESGLCEEAGGPKYSQSLCITSTGIDAANSLYAIKHLIYDTKQLTWEQLKKALAANFEGYEDIQQLLRTAPCYGNDDEYADEIGRELDRMAVSFAAKYGKEMGINNDARYVPFTSHVPFGKVVSATPNGRVAWFPLADGSSPSHGADHNGPTAILLSNHNTKNYGMRARAARLINVKFTPKCVEGDAGTEKLVQFIRTWCDLKLWHIQFNVINADTLKKAQKDPQKYRNLIVRIAGYSAYFVDLTPDLQNDLIARTGHDQM